MISKVNIIILLVLILVSTSLEASLDRCFLKNMNSSEWVEVNNDEPAIKSIFLSNSDDEFSVSVKQEAFWFIRNNQEVLFCKSLKKKYLQNDSACGSTHKYFSFTSGSWVLDREAIVYCTHD